LNFIIYDLEATCWLGAPPNNVQEIIEIGAVKVNPYGEQLGTFNRFVKPYVNTKLSAFCTELTSIEQSQVDAGCHFPTVLDEFQDWAEVDVDDYTLVSWGKEDQRLLRNDCALHNLEYDWLKPHMDLKLAYKSLKRLSKPTGLAKTIVREGLEFDGQPHRAIYDAINTGKIFVLYIDEWAY